MRLLPIGVVIWFAMPLAFADGVGDYITLKHAGLVKVKQDPDRKLPCARVSRFDPNTGVKLPDELIDLNLDDLKHDRTIYEQRVEDLTALINDIESLK